jgi:hypothetical protein
MPFTIRPSHRFPLRCSVSYNAGPCQGQGTIWNLSCSGWLLSGNLPMRPVGRKITPLSLLIVAWLIAWVTTVPLFHTHLPDITEGPATLHGGLAHTVFSPDLPGEFSRSYNVTHQDHDVHLSNRVSNSPELGIVLLENDEAKHRKVGHPSVLIVLCCPPMSPLLSLSTLDSAAVPRVLLFVAPQGPRPPAVVSL